MSAAVARRPRARRPSIDPVLTLPAAVLAGLGIGWIGENAGVGGGRIAVDLLVSWTLVAASLHDARPQPLAALGDAARGGRFALLGGDLQWADADVLWTVGFLAEGLVARGARTLRGELPRRASVVGRRRRRHRRRVPREFGGQALAALTAGGPRDVVAITANADRAQAIDRAQAVLAAAVALLVLGLVVRRLHDLGRPARLVQGPVFVAAAVCALLLLAGLAAYADDRLGATGLHVAAAIGSVLVPVGVIVGLLGSRLRRPGASELVVELQTGGTASLRDRLAAALDDETLELAYRIDGVRYVDAAGRPMDITGSPDRAVTLIRSGGEEVAALVHDPALLDDPALVESVRATAALVLENERLAAEVLAQLAEVRASRARLVAVADAERQRIERNLHDGLQQRLVTLCLDLGLAAGRADADAPAALARAHDEVEQAIADLRELARGIHPTLLREEGLEAAVDRGDAPDAAPGGGALRGRRSLLRRRRARCLPVRVGGAHERRQARLGLCRNGADRTPARDAQGRGRRRRHRRCAGHQRFGPGRPAGIGWRRSMRRSSWPASMAVGTTIRTEIPCAS